MQRRSLRIARVEAPMVELASRSTRKRNRAEEQTEEQPVVPVNDPPDVKVPEPTPEPAPKPAEPVLPVNAREPEHLPTQERVPVVDIEPEPTTPLSKPVQEVSVPTPAPMTLAGEPTPGPREPTPAPKPTVVVREHAPKPKRAPARVPTPVPTARERAANWPIPAPRSVPPTVPVAPAKVNAEAVRFATTHVFKPYTQSYPIRIRFPPASLNDATRQAIRALGDEHVKFKYESVHDGVTTFHYWARKPDTPVRYATIDGIYYAMVCYVEDTTCVYYEFYPIYAPSVTLWVTCRNASEYWMHSQGRYVRCVVDWVM